jgi:hypothetical protein
MILREIDTADSIAVWALQRFSQRSGGRMMMRGLEGELD